MENRLSLEGTLVKKHALRYTPAGIPIVESVIRHASVQMDGKRPRAVELEMDTQSTGDMALRMQDMAEGAAIRVEGFLARRSLKSTRIVLHVQVIAERTVATSAEQTR